MGWARAPPPNIWQGSRRANRPTSTTKNFDRKKEASCGIQEEPCWAHDPHNTHTVNLSKESTEIELPYWNPSHDLKVLGESTAIRARVLRFCGFVIFMSLYSVYGGLWGFMVFVVVVAFRGFSALLGLARPCGRPCCRRCGLPC